MLTRDDLEQIRGIVREEVKTETEPIKKQLQTQGKNIKAIKKTVDLIGRTFDRNDVAIIKSLSSTLWT